MSDLRENPLEELPLVDDPKEEIKEEKKDQKDKKDHKDKKDPKEKKVKKDKKEKKEKKFEKFQERKCKGFGPRCQMDPRKMKEFYKMKLMRKLMKLMRFYYGFPSLYQMYYGIQPYPYFMHQEYEMGPPPQIFGQPKHCHRHQRFGMPPGMWCGMMTPGFQPGPKHCQKHHGFGLNAAECIPPPPPAVMEDRKHCHKHLRISPPGFKAEQPKHCHKYHGYGIPPSFQQGPLKHCHKLYRCRMTPPRMYGLPKFYHMHHKFGMRPLFAGKTFKYWGKQRFNIGKPWFFFNRKPLFG